MFENFTFDTTRSLSVDSNTMSSRSVSPCSATSPYPAAEYSMTDLAADFDRQRLRQNSQIYSQPCNSYAAVDDDAGWLIEPETSLPPVQRVRSAPLRSMSPTRRRTDRQANARLLCSATHHRDIAALVTKMITQQEQCSVCPPSAITSAVDDDEVDLSPLSRQSSGLSITRSKEYRRPSDMRKTGASICKDIRLRKDKSRRTKSVDK
ncbi:hypothetical protein AMS68_003569 [Peltaster fructicola]|uniref:Uncharacterized protein n=1 Tax=Peltaster fructicola TaxID=286661 RepID=A0A6H0XTF1_9PEZI|nr:hypothetical protein AMS68_003569 [Peltaster fructicola]